MKLDNSNIDRKYFVIPKGENNMLAQLKDLLDIHKPEELFKGEEEVAEKQQEEIASGINEIRAVNEVNEVNEVNKKASREEVLSLVIDKKLIELVYDPIAHSCALATNLYEI